MTLLTCRQFQKDPSLCLSQNNLVHRNGFASIAIIWTLKIWINFRVQNAFKADKIKVKMIWCFIFLSQVQSPAKFVIRKWLVFDLRENPFAKNVRKNKSDVVNVIYITIKYNQTNVLTVQPNVHRECVKNAKDTQLRTLKNVARDVRTDWNF